MKKKPYTNLCPRTSFIFSSGADKISSLLQ